MIRGKLTTGAEEILSLTPVRGDAYLLVGDLQANQPK